MSMNIIQFVCTCFFALFFCVWVAYVYRNSYQIILPGLQNAYIIWVIHFYISIFQIFALFLRPVWTPHPRDFIFEEPIVCKIWGRTLLFIIAMQTFFITAFSGEKVQLYLKFYSCSSLSKVFKTSVWLGLLPNIGICIFYQSGPSIKNGQKRCGEIDRMAQLCFSLSYLHWIVMNCIMVCIFRCSKQFTNGSFPSLELQVRINKKLLPLMFVTSVFLFSFFVIHQFFERNHWIVFSFSLCHAFDAIFNSMLMHYTLFGHVGFLEKKDEIRTRFKMMMDAKMRRLDEELADSDISGSCDLIGYYWVEFPASHPVEMSYRTVKDEDLWDYVISDRRMLHQIEMCQSNGAMPSISCTLTCTQSSISESSDFPSRLVNGQAVE